MPPGVKQSPAGHLAQSPPGARLPAPMAIPLDTKVPTNGHSDDSKSEPTEREEETPPGALTTPVPSTPEDPRENLNDLEGGCPRVRGLVCVCACLKVCHFLSSCFQSPPRAAYSRPFRNSGLVKY